MTTPTLNLIGAGRVGQTLAHLWHRHKTFTIQDILTTQLQSAEAACATIGAGTPVVSVQAMRPADIWMIAVPDAQIEIAVATLQQLNTAQQVHTSGQSPIIFHCSGALSASLLTSLATLGFCTASAHCILSFASVPAALQQFNGTACALEGDAIACQFLQLAFTSIGAQCFQVQSENKVLYHAAAVFATNFLPVIQKVAEDAWLASGVPDKLIPQLRASLLQNAAQNIIRLSPAHALTGPAARGDIQAIEKQAGVVNAWDMLAGNAYIALSQLALRIQASKSSSN